MKKASKFLSLVLRHKPEAADLTLDENGWVPVNDVLRALKSRFAGFTRSDLVNLVADNDKQRFAFNDRGDKIRANQGHSVTVDLQLESTTPPPILYHGTKTQFMDSILREGLKPGSRQHVHLSPDIETARIVASRRTGSNVIFTVDTTKVDGQFFRSENGVWLTDKVPPDALTPGYE
jgi:putative RNA 2'-phosphotransferase